jgi:nucleoside-diphosphate-sugar epimerase
MDIPVRAVNRSGDRPGLLPIDVELVVADAADPNQAVNAARGASVIYQALNPAYHLWQQYFPGLQAGALAAAKAVGARFVSIENLYMYDSSEPIVEDTAIRPRSKKGELRAKMADEVMEAHQRAEIQATALRSSDYYGPGVLGSAMGDMVFGNLVAEKKAQIGGASDMPHSWAYIEDVGRAAAILGTHSESAGQIWIAPHAPAQTQGQMVEIICQVLGIIPRFTVISPMMMRLAGLFIPGARASVEMLYEFTEPFLVNSSKFTKTFLMDATPVRDGIKNTVDWYRAYQSQ